MRIDQLLQTGLATAEDHVVCEQDGTRLALDQPPRRPHGVSEAQWFLLLDISDVDQVAQAVDLCEDAQQVVLAPLAQVVLQLERPIEVVHDGSLAAAGDHDHLLDTARDRLLDPVLDRRLVDEGQHLLGLRLGDRQESCPQTRSGEDRLAHGGCGH
jgi:hypothetical protein